ncbi:MAG: hypothetical protein LUG52_04815 [Clostridia bacterium]|nr:hypothetical protein [Clostridia bacterium]
MQGFVDTHSHILFSTDDGARDIEESMEMLRAERNEGADAVFLTPHFYEGEKNSTHIAERFEKLKLRAATEVPELKLYLGNEILCLYDAVGAVLKNEARTYGTTKYVLIEFVPQAPFDTVKGHIEAFLREGYVPVVAHCERYDNVFKTQGGERLREIVQMGALIQINCDTFVNAGFFEGRYLKKILREGLVFAVGTDAHNNSSRAPRMKKAYDWVVKNAGRGIADKIFRENARALINNS